MLVTAYSTCVKYYIDNNILSVDLSRPCTMNIQIFCQILKFHKNFFNPISLKTILIDSQHKIWYISTDLLTKMIWKHSQNHKLIQLIKIPPYVHSYKYSFTKFTDIVNSITTLSKPPTWIHSIILNTICKTKSISCKKNTELPIFSIKHKYFQNIEILILKINVKFQYLLKY